MCVCVCVCEYVYIVEIFNFFNLLLKLAFFKTEYIYITLCVYYINKLQLFGTIYNNAFTCLSLISIQICSVADGVINKYLSVIQ